MKTVTLWLNLYRSGHYHRQGKPYTTNLHAGDVYATEEAALAAAEPNNGYVDTVPFTATIPSGMHVVVNPEDSIPTPLAATRYPHGTVPLLPWYTADAPSTSALTGVDESLDTGEAEARPYFPSYAGDALAGRFVADEFEVNQITGSVNGQLQDYSRFR